MIDTVPRPITMVLGSGVGYPRRLHPYLEVAYSLYFFLSVFRHFCNANQSFSCVRINLRLSPLHLAVVQHNSSDANTDTALRGVFERWFVHLLCVNGGGVVGGIFSINVSGEPHLNASFRDNPSLLFNVSLVKPDVLLACERGEFAGVEPGGVSPSYSVSS